MMMKATDGASRVTYRVVSLSHNGREAVPAGSLSEPAANLDRAKQRARYHYPRARNGWYGPRYGVRIVDGAGRPVCDLTVEKEYLGIREWLKLRAAWLRVWRIN